MLVEAIVAFASAGLSAGAFAVSQRASAALRDSFPDVRRNLRMLPLAGGWAGEAHPDADLLAAIEKGEADAHRGAAGLAAGNPLPADRGDRRSGGDPG